MKDNAGTMGDDLAKRMRETITEHVINSESTEFTQLSDFLDKEDMTEKYKDKPRQLESIWQNAKRMPCPVRNVTVWQDPMFKLKHCDEAMHEKKNVRSV